MRYLLSVFALLFAFAAHAATPEETVRGVLDKLAPGATVSGIEESPLPGFYQAVVGSQYIYISKDGRFLLDGGVYDVLNKVDITEAARDRQRAAGLAKIGADKRIVFAPANPKHSVTVFTDIDCPFCRRFHAQIDKYMAAGIAVEYVFLPLDIHPGADLKSEAIWCATDRKAALNAAMSGTDPGKAKCPNPIKELTDLARQMGVNSTPTMLAADGSKVSPQIAMTPDMLSAELDRLASAASKAP